MLLKDLQFAIRGLLKHPGFTAIAIITLALGIGANTAIFSVTDKLLIRSLPVEKPDELVAITSVSVNPHFVSNAFSYPNFADYRSQNQVLSGLLAFTRQELEFKTSNGIERVNSELVSANYFDVLGLTPAHGRFFLPEEDRNPGTQPVAVVTESFINKYLGVGSDPLGRKITLNDIPLTIIGVVPPTFKGMVLEQPTEIWAPVLMHPQLTQSKFIEQRKGALLQLLGRVKTGVGHAQAESGMDLVYQQVKEANTPAGTITKGLPFSEQHIKFEPAGKGISLLRKRFAGPLKLLMAVVGLVLLIACANVAGLLLARGVARRKEMAIRLSLGASGWRLVRQLLTESMLLASVGGALALLLAPWLVALLVKSQSRLELAQALMGKSIDLRVLLFTLATTTIAGIVFGLVPAWQSSRANLLPALKDESTGLQLRDRRFNFRSLIVVTQLALAIVVLIGAGLCVKSLRNLLAIDPGYQTETLLLAPLELDEKRYDEVKGRAVQQELYERLTRLPGVESVSYGSVLPLGGSRYMKSIFVPGREPLPSEQMAFDANVVGPHYHETMGIAMVHGRDFTEQDRQGTTPVVVISQALARRLFGEENVVGRQLSLKTRGGAPVEIIGVARDIKYHDLTEDPLPHVDLPALQSDYDSYTTFVVRSRSEASGLIPAVRRDFLSLDQTLPVMEIGPMSAQISNTLAATRLASTLIAIFGLLALMLASIGLYGVMSWMVGRRTHEIGIRLALGAPHSTVLRLILWRGLSLTTVGLVLGLAVAFATTRLLESQLYQVKVYDPFTFVSVALLLTFVSLLACYLPARRAARVDPLVALRYE
ncbi:MAG TPA: ABC transporter permease [Pyrinomonadaceae bacterium]|nr:ABC transporter permease [Pyrinomonadaceae bacterium]